MVEPHQQWLVHRYYRTDVDLPDDDLLAGRTALTRAEPSLPQAASKVYRRLERYFVVALDYSDGGMLRFTDALASMYRSDRAGVPVSSGDDVLVLPLVQPTVDVDLLAEAVIVLAEELGQSSADDVDELQDAA